MARSSISLREGILWAVLALAIGIAFAMAAIPTISPSSDLWDYAQEARQITRGEGFTSLYTYPLHLGRYGPPFPVFWRMPLYAGLGAVLIRMGAELPSGFLLIAAVAHAALVALVFVFAASLGSRLAGGVAAAAAIACPLLLDSYNPGMSQVPAAALGLAAWIFLVRGRGLSSAVLGALSAAAAWYLRGEAALMVPLWVLAALLPASGGGGYRWGRATVFAIVCLLAALPWVLWVAQIHVGTSPIRGNPTLLYTPEYPGYSSARMLGAELPGVLGYIADHPRTFAVRYAKDLVGYGVDLLGGLGPVALGLAIAGILLSRAFASNGPAARLESPPVARGVILLLCSAIAVQVGVLSALERSPRFLVPIVPMACILIGLAARPIVCRLNPRRFLIALLAVLIAERAAVVAFQRADAGGRFPPLPRELSTTLEPLARNWSQGALVLTDVPDWVAWRLDRPAILLPMWRDLPTLLGRRQVSAILLSDAARSRNVSDGDRDWVRVIDEGAPIPGFTGPVPLPGGSRLYLPFRR
jgi:hypothetical protein